MNATDSVYCRLCAVLTQTSQVIDLSVNMQMRSEIIDKLSIFSVNTVDFTDQTLPETVCLLCKESVGNSYDFFKKIQATQRLLKILKNTLARKIVYTSTVVLTDTNEVKQEEIPAEVKDEKSEAFDEKNTSFVECYMIKTEMDVSEDPIDNDEVSSNLYEASISKNLPSVKKQKVKNLTTSKTKSKNNSVCPNDDHYLCTTCGKSFSSWKELHRHTSTDNDHIPKKRTKATIEEKTCDICFKVFDIPAKLRYHKVKHSERPRDYVCDVCGKAFYAKDSLNTHKIIHNPETQDCKICKKTFISLIRLRKHLKTHEVLKPFECNECQRMFRTKYQLRKHMVVHSDVFPYSCEFCKKGFRFKNVLKTHENIHTGAKPFVCTVCGMDFTNWSNCNKHMVRKHGVSLAKRVKTAHGMMPINQETLKPKEVDMESVKWGEQMTKPRKRGRKVRKEAEDPP